MACLDTNIVIEILRGNPKITKFLKEYARIDKLCITTITRYELLKHFNDERRKDAVAFANTIALYPFDERASDASSIIFERLKKKGTLITENDILIAGISLSLDQLLITLDKGFEKVEGLKVLVP